MVTKTLLLSIFLIQFCSAQYTAENRTCDDFCPSLNISSIDEYFISGVFTQYAAISYSFENGADCLFFNVTITSLTTAAVAVSYKSNGHRKEVLHRAELAEDGLTFYVAPLDIPLPQRLVAATGDFLVAVSCHECGLYSEEGKGFYGRILVRNPFPSQEIIDEAFEAAEKCGIPKEAFVIQNNLACQSC